MTELPAIVRGLAALVGLAFVVLAWKRAVAITPRTDGRAVRWAVAVLGTGGLELLGAAGAGHTRWLLWGLVMVAGACAVLSAAGLFAQPRRPQPVRPSRAPRDWGGR